MVIIQCSIERKLQPIVAIAEREALSPSSTAGGILLGIRLLVETQITHVVVVTQVGVGIQVPYTGTIDRAVEHKGSHHIPVAIDILRSGDSTTSLLIVGHLVADAIVGGREVDEGHDTLVMVLHEIVVEQSEVLGERWLQARVTLRDVQRVAVICDIKQLRDAWLRSGTTVVHTQVAHL